MVEEEKEQEQEETEETEDDDALFFFPGKLRDFLGFRVGKLLGLERKRIEEEEDEENIWGWE